MVTEEVLEQQIDENVSENSILENSNVSDEVEPSENISDDNSNHPEVEPEKDENEAPEILSKFKTLDDAVKSYSELQKKLGQQSNELGELRKKAELVNQLQQDQNQFLSDYGFNSMDDYKQFQLQNLFESDIADFQADEYSRFADRCETPAKMRELIYQFKQNPSAELLNSIEAQFPLDVVKEVTANVALKKGELQNLQFEAQQKVIEESAKLYLKDSLSKYSEEFTNPAFKNLFAEAFRAYGINLDAERFVGLLKDYGESLLKANGIKNGIALENSQATDEIAGLANTNTRTSAPEKNILEMSEEEVKRELKKYR